MSTPRTVPTVAARGRSLVITRGGIPHALVVSTSTEPRHAAATVRGALADAYHAGRSEMDTTWREAVDAHIERTAAALNGRERAVRVLAEKLEAGESVRAEYVQASAELRAVDAAITALIKLRDERKK